MDVKDGYFVNIYRALLHYYNRCLGGQGIILCLYGPAGMEINVHDCMALGVIRKLVLAGKLTSSSVALKHFQNSTCGSGIRQDFKRTQRDFSFQLTVCSFCLLSIPASVLFVSFLYQH